MSRSARPPWRQVSAGPCLRNRVVLRDADQPRQERLARLARAANELVQRVVGARAGCKLATAHDSVPSISRRSSSSG